MAQHLAYLTVLVQGWRPVTSRVRVAGKAGLALNLRTQGAIKLKEVFPFSSPELSSFKPKSCWEQCQAHRVVVQCSLELPTEKPQEQPPPRDNPLVLEEGPNCIQNQREDLVFSRLHGRLTRANAVLVDPDNYAQYSHFELKVDLFVRVMWEKKNGAHKTQLLIPKFYQNQVLKLAQDVLWSGHVGAEKTPKKIQAQLFLQGVYGDIKDQCASFPECQVVAPSQPTGPPQSSSIGEQTFLQNWGRPHGVTGPNSSHCWFILVIVDYGN
ncbi:unnamed protein product [Natator depressus]